MFAAAPNPEPAAIGQWIMVAAFLLGMAVNLAALLRINKAQTTQVQPQPLAIAMTEKIVTKDECVKLHNAAEGRIGAVETDMRSLETKVETCVQQLRGEIKDMDRSQEDRARRLHDRIDALGLSLTAAIGELKGKVR
jgi:hypothetical protein